MSIFLNCSGCGKQLKASAVHAGKQAQCPSCGALTVIPDDEAEVEAVVAEPVARRARSSRRRAEPEEDQACPECDASLPGDAVLCIHCGYDFRTGKRRRTVSKRLDRFWYGGMHLGLRLGILGLALMILLPVSVIIMTQEFLIGAGLAFVGTVFLVLIFGTFATVRVHRTKQGKTLLTKTSYFVFCPAITREVNLKRYAAVVIEHTVGFGPIGIGIMIGLVFLGVIPGLIWWYWAFTKDTFRVFLRGHRRDEELTLYRGMSLAVVKDITETVQEVGGLSIER
jgi:ribosomal protein L40E